MHEDQTTEKRPEGYDAGDCKHADEDANTVSDAMVGHLLVQRRMA
jgi:hypothetical protein